MCPAAASSVSMNPGCTGMDRNSPPGGIHASTVTARWVHRVVWWCSIHVTGQTVQYDVFVPQLQWKPDIFALKITHKHALNPSCLYFKAGEVSCEHVDASCPASRCSHPAKRTEECCPTCEGQRILSTAHCDVCPTLASLVVFVLTECQYDNRVYADGSVFSPTGSGPCLQCRCKASVCIILRVNDWHLVDTSVIYFTSCIACKCLCFRVGMSFATQRGVPLSIAPTL